jgi:hypothetical protein
MTTKLPMSKKAGEQRGDAKSSSSLIEKQFFQRQTKEIDQG